MAMQINTNVTAMNALRNLTSASNAVATSTQRLSSGLRINNAADDPAGLIISEGLRAQIDGLNQAVSNSQDAGNVLKTAEGGLTEVNGLLRNVRQLAVHASNSGVNDQIATQADQNQIASAVASIQRIAEQTQFGTKHLLDGSSGVSSSVVDTKDAAAINIGGQFGSQITQSGPVTVSVTTVATRATAYTQANAATYASVNATIGSVNGTTIGSGGSVVLNGQSVTVSGSDTVQSLINKINNVSSTTGVSADFTFGNGSGSVVLTSKDYGANSKIAESESSNILLTGANTSQAAAGANAVATVTAMTLNAIGATVSTSVTFKGGTATGDSGMKLSDGKGNTILLTEQGNSVNGATTYGTINSANVQFQIGANAGQTVNISMGNIRTSNLGNTSVAGKSLATIDVTTNQGASDAITMTDEAISQVSQLRSSMGAFQKNTLDSAVRSLGVAVENLSASESQIRDTNVATEVMNLTKSQIIQSAATTVLAQANAAPNSVLSLLR